MIQLGPIELALAALLLLGHAAASLALGLGLGRTLLLAALRATLQLALLGLVLEHVLTSHSPALVFGLILGMSLLAGHEAVRRGRYRVRGGYAASTTAMLASAFLVTLYATQVVLRVEPWYAPRYLLPIAGMLLGNAMNGIALGLDSTLAGFAQERERIELLLACGATRSEASRSVVRRAVNTGLLPILNGLVAAGAIAIPGMMTGQILAGESPGTAARYQLLILLCIAGAVALGTLCVVLWTRSLVFDERDRLRLERIHTRGAP